MAQPGQPNVEPESKRSAAERRKLSKEYAEAHGLQRGTHAGTSDELPCGEQPDLDADAIDEGLAAFVQSVRCRREIWAAVYESPREGEHQMKYQLCTAVLTSLPDCTVPCCDLCDPSLLARTRPGPSPRLQRATKVKRGQPVPEYQSKLHQWRMDVFDRDHAGSQWDYTGILSQSQVEHLTSVGPINKAKLTSILGVGWVWWDEYGKELLALMGAWPIPFIPTPRKAGSKPPGAQPGAKRRRAPELTDEHQSGSSNSKRSRKERTGPINMGKHTVNIGERTL